MHKNPVWLGFLIFVAVATAYFVGVAADRGSYYRSLNTEVPTKTIRWSFTQVSGGYYVPVAHYSFMHDGVELEGKHELTNRASRNEPAAAQMVEALAKREWTVWYDSKNLEHSAIDKQFPLSEVISGTLMLVIFFYFIWLGQYVAKKTTIE